MGPIKTEFIKFPKCDLIKNRLLISIDSGISLTKILFLNKDKKEQFLNEAEEFLTLDFNLFPNSELECALECLKLNAFGLEDNDYKLHVTGVFVHRNQEKIKSILNKEITFIHEHLTIIAGHKFALEHIGLENMLSEAVEVKTFGSIDNNVIKKMMEAMSNRMTKDENELNKLSLYPCLFNIQGSCSYCLYIDENGISDTFGAINPGGKSFLGLAKCILDTNDYGEIVELASRGDRGNVDTLVKDVLDDNIDSPYGKFPRELPLMCFGKCSDQNKEKEDCRKEDLALSLVALHAQTFVSFCLTICKLKKISKVYLTGNLFISDVFQREILKFISVFPLIDFVFLDCGYVGTLGAMLSDNEDKNKHIKIYDK